MKKTRLLIADDHAVVRQGMAAMLRDEEDFEVVGGAANGQEAVEMARKLMPNVILMDMSMPILNGIEATRIISRESPDIRIIGLSMFEDSERAEAMRDAVIAGRKAFRAGRIPRKLHAVASMAKRAEKHYGCPQDIEWALDADLPDGANLLLLQSRPETVHSTKTVTTSETVTTPETSATTGFSMASITSALTGKN